MDWACRSAPAFYRRLDYRLLDVSRRRVEEQKETLALYEREGKVSWGAAKGISVLDVLKMRLSIKHLIEPGVGMGEIFKVLI